MKFDLRVRFAAAWNYWSEVSARVTPQRTRGISGTVVAHIDCKATSGDGAR
jgi:hypothetical protein